MKNTLNYFIVILISASVITSCNSRSYDKAENAQDAGREFIRASLDGDYKKAKFYLLKDTTNLLLLIRQQRDYEQLNDEQKKLHRESSIRPISIIPTNDSITIYKYFNTYNPKDTTSIRVVRANGDWLVDLKSILKL
ncbi:MAG: hypothetical protein ABI415_02195 [Flavitalea sp.]